MKKLSQLLKEAREKAEMSQIELANAIGVSASSLRAIEQGYMPKNGWVIGKVEEWIEKQKGGR